MPTGEHYLEKVALILINSYTGGVNSDIFLTQYPLSQTYLQTGAGF